MILLSVIVGVFIGATIGLIGSGGSLIAIPALTIFLDQDIVSATTASALIVTLASLTAIVGRPKNHSNLNKTWIFPSIPGIIGAILGGLIFDSVSAILIYSAISIMMLLAAFLVYKFQNGGYSKTRSTDFRILFILSLTTGFISGLLGIGGGFLIIPILMRFGHLSFKVSVSSSQLFVLTNSSVALFTRLQFWSELAWSEILPLATAAIITVALFAKWSSDQESKLLVKLFSSTMVFGACSLILLRVGPMI